MTNDKKIMTAHLQRFAYIYVRQSTAAQVEHNRESTDRQYKLLERAHDLGWPKDQVGTVGVCPYEMIPQKNPLNSQCHPRYLLNNAYFFMENGLLQRNQDRVKRLL